MIDGLVMEQNAKQWDAREQQWRREDQARINLLKDVYKNREESILLKQKMKEEQQWLRSHEKATIDQQVDAQNKAHEERALREAYERKTH